MNLELDYESLEVCDGKLSEDGFNRIKDLVKIVHDGNIIYICHPRHIFDNLDEDTETKIIRSVDLASINLERMKSIKAYGKYSIVEQICSKNDNQLTYLNKYSTHLLRKYREQGNVLLNVPLAIIEQHYDDLTGNIGQISFRGIINFTQNGISIAYGPNVVRRFPNQSVWEKALNISDAAIR